MKSVIIEDEKPAGRMLERALSVLGVEVAVILCTVEDSVDWFMSNPHPDLIFLDIQLSDGLSFEIFDKVPIKSHIIFTTAYEEYALKAFKLNSVDYLLKPIVESELKKAVEKFLIQRNTTQLSAWDHQYLRKLLFNFGEHSYRQRFVIKVGEFLKIITTDEISLFYSGHRGTYIHTYEGRDFPIEYPLEQLEQELDPKHFFRISRKYIVPLNVSKEIQIHSNSRLKIIIPGFNVDEVIVSRDKVANFKKWLE